MEMNVVTVIGLLGFTTLVGAFGLAHKYFDVLRHRDINASELKKLELEIAQRNTELREKEMELEVRRLEFDIQALEQKNEPKKLL